MKTVFELSGENTGHTPSPRNPEQTLPPPFGRKDLPLPDLSEVQVIRHYTALSRRNYGVDTGFYPLGSCTMKYNPKINEDIARLEGFAGLHPSAPEECAQGALRILYDTEKYLCEITGMDAFTLCPDAGAHGELTAVMIARKHFGGARTKIIVPDTAHGTNPASSAMAGFTVETIKSNPGGTIDISALKNAMSHDVAMLMVTNPNTLGLFEKDICKVADIVHSYDALLYCDGANMNAMLGISRPGDQGFDMMHLNLHKTFSTPHGGGGPGSGPVGVKKHLEKYLPVPRVICDSGRFRFRWDCPDTIGKVSSFYGNFGVVLKAYTYIRANGPGLKTVSEMAVLNANYVMRKLEPFYDIPYNQPCAHEFVLSGTRRLGEHITTMDIAKRLLDYGHHAPTIYFPLIVKEAMMIEPTETEDKETLDSFIEAMIKISQEPADVLHKAPVTTPVGRLDGVAAARKPNLTWNPDD